MTAKKLIEYKVAEHCKLHNISYKDLQRIEDKLKMQTKILLAEKYKNK